MGAPQIILLIWLIFEIILSAGTNGKTIKRNGPINVASYIGMLALLYWGGFFS